MPPVRSKDIIQVCFFVALGLLTTGHLSAESDFKAGAAERDVTPTEPVPMWGYGARHDLLSTGTLDPLKATAVVIQAGSKKLAIVGLDLGRSPSERSLQIIRDRLKSEAGVEHSFIAGSHTHHGPVLELTAKRGRGKGRFDAALRYYTQLEDAIVSTVKEADQKLVSAKFAAGSTEIVGFNRNRHTKLTPKPVDQTLTVMRLDDHANRPIAILVNFAGHPTSAPSDVLQFSADYVGAMRSTAARELGGQVIFMQGASGDLSINKASSASHSDFGQALGREVVKFASSLQPLTVNNPSLTVREETFGFDSRVNFNSPLILGAYSAAFFPELILNFVDEYEQGVRPRLTVALLNQETAFVGVSGEFFCQHAMRLRERARLQRLFFFGYCNGYHQYFPTIEAVAEGGYGADSYVAPAAIGAGEQLMNTALTWIYQLQGKIK